MKAAVRGGHTEKATGANALIDELTEDRKVKNAVIKYLKEIGLSVLDVTPPVNANLNINTDLAYGVNKANEWGADIFISIHFNKAYDSYNGALGSEVCVYSENEIAQRIVNALEGLGFKNRGQKIRTELYELRHTNMKAMIVETCFIEATEDVALYKKLGPDLIGKTIAEAITNKRISVEVKENNEFNEEEYYMYLFSENWYLYRYNDVKQAVEKGTFKSGYEHYIKYGKNEKRQPVPTIPTDFSEGDYLELNPDVKQAVEKGDCISGAQHYMLNGFKETRKINKGETDEAAKKRIKELESKLDEIKKIVD